MKAPGGLAVEAAGLHLMRPRSRLGRVTPEDPCLPTTAHPLDRPVWGSLIGAWRPLAIQAGEALRLAPDYGPFAATPELTAGSLAGLAAFDLGEERLDLIEPVEVQAPPGLAVALQAPLVQMTASAILGDGPRLDVIPLGEADGRADDPEARLSRVPTDATHARPVGEASG